MKIINFSCFGVFVITLLIYCPTLVGEEIGDEFLLFEEIPMVITAARKPQRITEASSTIDIITSDDIRLSGARNIAELLEKLPGIYTPIAHNGLDMLWIRGVGRRYNDNALMLIDGVPYRTLYYSNFPINEQIPLEDVSRIEVIRGPGSALYGTSAFTGVINILTKNGFESEGLAISAENGSWQSSNQSLLSGRIFDGGEFVISGRILNTDGHDAAFNDEAIPTIESLEVFNKSLTAKVVKGNFKFGVRYSNTKLNDFTSTTEDEEGGTTVREHVLINSSYRWQYSDVLSFNFTAYHNEFDLHKNRIGVDENSVPVLESETEQYSTITGLEILGTAYLSEQQTLIFGITAVQERLHRAFSRVRESFDEPFELNEWASESGGDLPERINQDIWGAYVEDEIRLNEKFLLTAGLRYDSVDASGSSFSPRLSLVYKIDANSSLRIRYGHAFRAPTFEELYRKSADGEAEGNRDLNPQTIETYEIDYGLDFGESQQFSSTFFYSNIKDFIAVIGDENFKNLDDRRYFGLELSLKGHLSQSMSYFTNYTYTKGREGGDEIGSIPSHMANFGMTYTGLKYIDLTTHLRWVGSRSKPTNYQIDVDPELRRDLLSGYGLMNFTIRTNPELFGPVSVTLSVKNLTNKKFHAPGEITEDYDVRQPSRRVTLKLEYRW